MTANHSASGLMLPTSLQAGGIGNSHHATAVVVRAAVRAGGQNLNHNESRVTPCHGAEAR